MRKEGKGVGVFLSVTAGGNIDALIEKTGSTYHSRAHCIAVLAERELERVRKLAAIAKNPLDG